MNSTPARPTVFLSYRRHDTPAHARRLHDALLSWFPPARLGMDAEGTNPGVACPRALNEAPAPCAARVVLPGPGCLAAGASAHRGPEAPHAFVRIETRACPA